MTTNATNSVQESANITAYAAAKYVNSELEKAGVSKRIPPQMMYNYTSARLNAGKKPFIEYTIEKGVNEESLKEWTKKYVSKQLAAVVVES